MEEFEGKVIFLDSSALRALKFSEISLLLHHCKEGTINICLSQWALIERARQYAEKEFNQLFENPQFESLIPLKDLLEATWFKAVLKIFYEIFDIPGVEIVEHTSALERAAREQIDLDSTYFTIKSRRDAYIFCTALATCTPETTVILCNDKALNHEFTKNSDFVIQTDVKKFLSPLFDGFEVPRLVVPDIVSAFKAAQTGDLHQIPEAAINALKEMEPKYQRLGIALTPAQPLPEGEVTSTNRSLDPVLDGLSEQEKELRIKILGFVNWFDPITKDELSELLKTFSYQDEEIEISAKVLCHANLIEDTGKFYIPSMEAICEEAASEVIEDILEIVENR